MGILFWKHGRYTKVLETRDLVTIALLATVNVSSRLALQFLPNIKPVTTIIIVVSLVMGAFYGVILSVVTVLLSGVLMGFGTFIPFQIMAWSIISLIAGCLHYKYQRIPCVYMAILSALGGFLYGFFVSLDKLLIGGPYAFIAYYISGLSFDALHASGNFLFYVIFAPILIKLMEKRTL